MWVGGQGHAPAALPPGQRFGTPFTRGWVGTRAGLDECGMSRLNRYSIPGQSSP
jgi:hypothetical protein